MAEGIDAISPHQVHREDENVYPRTGESNATGVYPKGEWQQRPLGIPTMKDQVAQASIKNALEPEWEAKRLLESWLMLSHEREEHVLFMVKMPVECAFSETSRAGDHLRGDMC